MYAEQTCLLAAFKPAIKVEIESLLTSSQLNDTNSILEDCANYIVLMYLDSPMSSRLSNQVSEHKICELECEVVEENNIWCKGNAGLPDICIF